MENVIIPKFKVNDKVRINSQKYFSENINNKIGTIIRIDIYNLFINYYVKIDNLFNSRISDGCYIFKEYQLEFYKETTQGGNNMLLKGYKLVGVKFDGNDTEYVFASYEKGLKEGDLVVVDTKYGLKLAVISSISMKTNIDTSNLKQIVSKVNTKSYYERIEKCNRLKELRSNMNKRIEEFKQDELLKIYAKQDKEFAKLYDEYQSLQENS